MEKLCAKYGKTGQDIKTVDWAVDVHGMGTRLHILKAMGPGADQVVGALTMPVSSGVRLSWSLTFSKSFLDSRGRQTDPHIEFNVVLTDHSNPDQYFCLYQFLFEKGDESHKASYPGTGPNNIGTPFCFHREKLEEFEKGGTILFPNDTLRINLRVFIVKKDASKPPIAAVSRPLDFSYTQSPCVCNLIYKSLTRYDTLIRCGGTAVEAHKVVLSNRSAVLAQLIKDSSPGDGSSVVEIVVEGKVEVLKLLLEYLYTGRLNVPTEPSDLGILLQWAAAYQLPEVKQRCLLEMVKNVTDKNICSLLPLSLEHDTSGDATRALRDYCMRRHNLLLTTHEYQELLPKVLHLFEDETEG